jgi:lactate dehydrogenase-like 2-hydroxyacid dehydrogenase
MDRNLKIGVVGLGLIGGSIFKALCALKCNVYATSQSNLTIEKAKMRIRIIKIIFLIYNPPCCVFSKFNNLCFLLLNSL